MNLDDLSPPFPDTFVTKDKYAISEESYHGIITNTKDKFEIVEENTKMPITHYGEIPTSNVYNNYEKYPIIDYTINDKDRVVNSTPNYELYFIGEKKTSVESTKYPLLNQNDSKEKFSISDRNDYYFLNNKKFSNKNNHFFSDHNKDSTIASSIYNNPID